VWLADGGAQIEMILKQRAELVKDRMDITGARRGLESAEAILKLRALITNNDFDTYWHFHLTQNSAASTHTLRARRDSPAGIKFLQRTRTLISVM